MKNSRSTKRVHSSRQFPKMAAGMGVRAVVKKRGSSLLDIVTKSLKQEAAAAAEDLSIDALVPLAQKFAEKVKSPKGTTGRNLNLFKMQLLDQPAVGGTTESTSMFSYRPKRSVKTTDTIQYKAIRNKKVSLTNPAGLQTIADRNLAVLEPPQNDPLNTNSSWTNFSIRNEFDKMLLARTVSGSTPIDTVKQTLVANFHSLSSVMILRAPTQGAIVDIYDLQPKFSIGPGTYQTEVYSLDHVSPHWCFYEGFNTASLETQDAYDQTKVGADPLESPTFRRTWNIIKKTTVRMSSNAIHRHRFVFNINKSVTYDEMAQCSTNGGTVPWLPSQMVIVRGYPTTDSLAETVIVECQQESTLSYSSRLGKTTNVIVYNNNT